MEKKRKEKSEYVEDAIYKDFLNFLQNKPLQEFNLMPNSEGLVEVLLNNLEQYNSLTIVAFDNESVTQRFMSVNEILKNADEATLPKI